MRTFLVLGFNVRKVFLIGFDRLFYNLLREISLVSLSFPTSLPSTRNFI